PTNPGLSVTELVRRTPALDFLTERGARMTGYDDVLAPNLAMAYGIADVRGDDPLRARSYEAQAADLALPDGKALDAFSVRWVLAPPRSVPADATWRRAYEGADATVFERASALPLVRWEADGSDLRLEVRRRVPGRWELAWSGAPSSRIVVGER